MIDTRSKRASAASLVLPFLFGAVAPDGSIGSGDRYHAGHSYSGITVADAFPEEGALPEGTNPDPGDPVGSLHFAQVVVDGVSRFAAESIIRDPITAWGGKKPATLTKISNYRRELSPEGYRSSNFTIEISDHDNLWRGFAETETLEAIYVSVYRCSAPHGIIEGTPFRLMAGVVTAGGFIAEDGYRFRLECVDVLGEFFSDPEHRPKIPTKKLTLAEFAGMDPSLDGKVAPRCIGLLTEDGVGVVPGIYMGQVNPSVSFNASGVNALYHVLMISEGVVYDIPLLYINVLTWSASTVIAVGVHVRPTPDDVSAGADYLFVCTTGGTTDSTEPTWPTTGTVSDGSVTWTVVGPDDPTIRIPVPSSAYDGGTDFTHSRASNWTTVTGLATPYVDWIDGRRYTIALLKSDHYYAPFVAEGRVQPLFDVIGATTDADGDGPPILDPGEAYAYLLLYYLFADNDGTTDVTLPDLPALDGETAYSAIDMDSIAAQKALSDRKCGVLIGANGDPDDLWDVLGRITKDGGIDIGCNRHGQLIVSRRDGAASPTITFTEQKDYSRTHYKVDRAKRCTRVNYYYGPRYADPFPPVSTPAPGQPEAQAGRLQYGEWASGLQELISTVAESAVQPAFGQPYKRLIELEMDTTRDADTALQVARQVLNYGTGPSPAYHGTFTFEMVGPLERLYLAEDSAGNTRELGDVIAIDDPQGIGSAGYTAKTGRITAIDIDPERGTCTLEGEILDPVDEEEEEEEDPGALPLGGLTLHCDASDTDQVFTTQHGGGSGVHTGAPGDGDTVRVWDDEGDGISNICLPYRSAFSEPTYRSATPLMVLPCIDFSTTGTGDALKATDQAIGVDTPSSSLISESGRTVAIVFYPETITTDTSTTGQNHGLLGNSQWGLELRNNGGTRQIIAFATDSVFPHPINSVALTIAVNRTWIALMTHDGVTLQLVLIDDAGAETTASMAAGPQGGGLVGGFAVGCCAGGVVASEYFDGRIGEFCIWNTALAGAQLTAAKNYFKDKWL